jgi:hypothetical protein
MLQAHTRHLCTQHTESVNCPVNYLIVNFVLVPVAILGSHRNRLGTFLKAPLYQYKGFVWAFRSRLLRTKNVAHCSLGRHETFLAWWMVPLGLSFTTAFFCRNTAVLKADIMHSLVIT